jgi:hypothetical protein
LGEPTKIGSQIPDFLDSRLIQMPQKSAKIPAKWAEKRTENDIFLLFCDTRSAAGVEN